MAELYRKSALEKMSSPEQLDVPLKVTSPLSWLALLGATVLVAITIAWSIVGRLPMTVTASGIVAAPDSTNSIYSDHAGRVTQVYRSMKEKVYEGDEIMAIDTGNGDIYTVVSDQTGYISKIIVPENEFVDTQSSAVVAISPEVHGADQVVVSYFPVADAGKIEKGMEAYIYLTSKESQTYGHMTGRVVNIDTRPTTSTSQNYVLGKENNVASTFAATDNKGGVVAVTCELLTDSTSSNGFYWSNEKGYNVKVPMGAECKVRIVTKEIRPIAKLFEKLVEIWEGRITG